MKLAKVSTCGRFVVLEELHIDRSVFEALARWATEHGVALQHAIQLAVCAFNDAAVRVSPQSAQRMVASLRRDLTPDAPGDRPSR